MANVSPKIGDRVEVNREFLDCVDVRDALHRNIAKGEQATIIDNISDRNWKLQFDDMMVFSFHPDNFTVIMVYKPGSMPAWGRVSRTLGLRLEPLPDRVLYTRWDSLDKQSKAR